MAPHLISSSSTISAVQGEEGPHTKNAKDTPECVIKKRSNSKQNNTEQKDKPQYKWEIAWRNVFAFAVMHAMSLQAFYLLFSGNANWSSFLFSYFYGVVAGLGVTAGAHRLWAHRTYSAKLPLRIFLMILQTIALQNDLYIWTRDHRVHHKFTDTDADPHNSSRGFFFSHMGWLMLKKHPDVLEKGKSVDMSDMLKDPVVRFQRKYYIPLILLFNFMIPIFVVWKLCHLTFYQAFIANVTRYTISLHITWLVNSAAHIWGMKPYDRSINAAENLVVATLAMGEGWHNYHHVFPWDYKAAELGNYSHNFSTLFLDVMAKIGQAYDMKTASEELIRKRAERTGDKSWKFSSKTGLDTGGHHHHQYGEQIWGWGDKDMKDEDMKYILNSNRGRA